MLKNSEPEYRGAHDFQKPLLHDGQLRSLVLGILSLNLQAKLFKHVLIQSRTQTITLEIPLQITEFSNQETEFGLNYWVAQYGFLNLQILANVRL